MRSCQGRSLMNCSRNAVRSIGCKVKHAKWPVGSVSGNRRPASRRCMAREISGFRKSGHNAPAPPTVCLSASSSRARMGTARSALVCCFGGSFMASSITRGPADPTVPILEPGDHLTRQEFERRYEAMAHIKKAELIEGVVYMPSPVRVEQHAAPHAIFAWWLTHYSVFTPGVRVGDNATVRLDLDNEVQPDALMFREPSHGGRVVIGPRGYLEKAPELVGEIAASTASFDLHTKLRVYR